MTGFLEQMARSSAGRAALAGRGEAVLRRRAREAGPGPRLVLPPQGFDLIAEVKRRAPSAGRLAASRAESPALAAHRARLYERAGAAAISVLTEPRRFGGDLDDLRQAADAAGVPVMRKDFLVDPIQVIEARAAGAAGVLLILRILDDARLREMIGACAEFRLFALFEAFDERDLERAGEAARAAARAGVTALVGLNSRDLMTLRVDRSRLARLRPRFPSGVPAIAESGVATAAEARAVAALGYRAALVGGALMRAPRPGALAHRMIEAGREAAEVRCASA